MLTSIRRRKPEEEAVRDAIALLVECHGRIRQFTKIALRLANAKDVDDAEIREAANGLIRYFTIALPLHSEDEEESLHRRLALSEAPAEVKDALDGMVREHGPIHETIDALGLLWRELVENPARLAEHRAELLERATTLAELFEEHLAKEEAIVFPAARKYLRPEAIGEILEEMRARRDVSAF